MTGKDRGRYFALFFYLQRPCYEHERWLADSQWSGRGAWGSAEGNLLPVRWKCQDQMPGMPFFFLDHWSNSSCTLMLVFQQIYCLFFKLFGLSHFCLFLYFAFLSLHSWNLSPCVCFMWCQLFVPRVCCLVSFGLLLFCCLSLAATSRLTPLGLSSYLVLFSLAQSSIRLSSSSGESLRIKKKKVKLNKTEMGVFFFPQREMDVSTSVRTLHNFRRNSTPHTELVKMNTEEPQLQVKISAGADETWISAAEASCCLYSIA